MFSPLFADVRRLFANYLRLSLKWELRNGINGSHGHGFEYNFFWSDDISSSHDGFRSKFFTSGDISNSHDGFRRKFFPLIL